MKRMLAATALALGVAASGMAAPTANAATTGAGLPTGSCVYIAKADTQLYEDTQGNPNYVGQFRWISQNVRVAGPCRSSDGWTEINRVYMWGDWHATAAFVGDKDYMRTKLLFFYGTK
ncbi:hypothetical protein [Knoellia sp. LjRoot47]|uniref:hypothetical protein n=1 Tax=Knoellia sp. LjRoot47 TaxID=3342330 RepID=UPI003ECE7E73